MTNAYLPIAMVYYWTWIDNENYHFSEEYMLAKASMQLANEYPQKTVTVELAMRYEMVESTGKEEWCLVYSDDLINALYMGIYDCPYGENYNFVVTDQTFVTIEELTNTIRTDVEKLNKGKKVKQTKEELKELYWETALYNQMLQNCNTAWELSKTDAGVNLLTALEGILYNVYNLDLKKYNFDLTTALDAPLEQFKAA